MATLNVSAHLQMAEVLDKPQIMHVASDLQGQAAPGVLRLTDVSVQKRVYLDQLMAQHECGPACAAAVEKKLAPSLEDMRQQITDAQTQKKKKRARRRCRQGAVKRACRRRENKCVEHRRKKGLERALIVSTCANKQLTKQRESLLTSTNKATANHPCALVVLCVAHGCSRAWLLSFLQILSLLSFLLFLLLCSAPLLCSCRVGQHQQEEQNMGNSTRAQQRRRARPKQPTTAQEQSNKNNNKNNNSGEFSASTRAQQTCSHAQKWTFSS